MKKMNALEVTTGGGDEHAYVDLGLPSGLLWATCNVGANAPEEYGDYFLWGETQPKDYYNWSTYQYCNGTFLDNWGIERPLLTKYCYDANYGYNGFTDNLTILLPEDDAATANWGAGWRTPTIEEIQELYNNTTVIRTQQNGVYGELFTAANGNSIFLPATGAAHNSYAPAPNTAGKEGQYWANSLSLSYTWSARRFRFYEDETTDWSSGDRNYGRSVRPVREN